MTDVAFIDRQPELSGRDDRAFHDWLEEDRLRQTVRVERVPLEALTGWRTDPRTGNIHHDSGKFFSVQGLDVHFPQEPVSRWTQPIIVQHEVGILGILMKEFDDGPHFLMQAKVEPGNRNGVQISPTVQATRSNYTRVHQGKAVPYLDYFRNDVERHVVADARQSEQAAWFHRKRNRNMIVSVTEEIEVLDGFRWMTLAQLHRFFAVENLVNMDSRTVLSGLLRAVPAPQLPSRHSMNAVLSWITYIRSERDDFADLIPLKGLAEWERVDGRISHRSGCFFHVVGVDVRAEGREVRNWSQPMFEPVGTGLAAFVVTMLNGALHVLMHARAEPGSFDIVELAPTLQCTPANYDYLPPAARPPFLDLVLDTRPEEVLFDTVHSEEGGRFYHSETRYMIIEAAEPPAESADFRWVAVHQLVELLRHSHYLNIQCRSLLACLHSVLGDNISGPATRKDTA
jgi:dTDP-4-dehydro-6-deoxy-alpha-D-glucopyranose 2,3-dehydratase